MAANWLDGTGLLWHLNYKINTPTRGFNFKVHVPNVDEAAAIVIAARLGLRLLYLMPSVCEIFYATATKDDHDQDSRRVPGALGNGLYLQTGSSPAATKPDNSRSAVLCRFEHSAGGGVNMKIAPIPDTVCTDDTLTTIPASVVGAPVGALAAPGAGADFFVEFTNLMKDITQNCKAIKSGHPPGGAFKYANFVNAYYTRLTVKKGGRIFS